MRKIHSVFLVALLLPVIATAAPQTSPDSPRAQQMMRMLEQRFAAADTNHDGKLTLAEAQAGMPRVAQHFADIDTNHQGYITLDQIKLFMASRAGG
ncbi:EF-hand domain-containing protein [Dyella monticola]|uniref:EF-hand domain-containing protein n=1 Tax=Dyella monticola TaxID=1927958 RepID=A0A370WV48_9GAMM|nr:EF-hand domain-containing protein [Dyella monticola]RDS79887.1 EF-hand domain-containing protein [Dyella monticola]